MPGRSSRFRLAWGLLVPQDKILLDSAMITVWHFPLELPKRHRVCIYSRTVIPIFAVPEYNLRSYLAKIPDCGVVPCLRTKAYGHRLGIIFCRDLIKRRPSGDALVQDCDTPRTSTSSRRRVESFRCS